MTPEQYCQNRAAQSGSSFYYSFLFLEPEQRRAITALYAFCREVDDVVDECSDPAVARAKLDWWRNEVDQVYGGNPQHPVSRSLAGAVERFNLPQEYLIEILDGMEMDLAQTSYASFKELALYCHRVAGVVGLMAAEIFGYTNRATLTYAQQLGTAFQLTNIVRDVGEDARRGRIYLPLDELAAHKVDVRDVLGGIDSHNLRTLMLAQTKRARHYYRQAFAALPAEDRYAQRSGIIMAEIYMTLLNEIESDGFQVMRRRAVITPLRKFWIAWKTHQREKRLRCRIA